MKIYFPFKEAPAGPGPFNRSTAGHVKVVDGVAELDDRNPNTPDLADSLVAFYGGSREPLKPSAAQAKAEAEAKAVADAEAAAQAKAEADAKKTGNTK